LAIVDKAGTTVAEIQLANLALVAELTWAKLFTQSMHKDLGAISTALGKSNQSTDNPKMKKSAERLRELLQIASRTVGELSDQAGIRAVPVEK
jgi:hypothetical protein